MPGLRASTTPLPDVMMQAKTIHLVNKTGKQAILDAAYNEFDKWGRFRVVEGNNADLIAVFSRASIDDPDDNGPATRMDIKVRGDEDPTFETTAVNTKAPGIYGLLIHDGSAQKCVDDFRKQFEKQAQTTPLK